MRGGVRESPTATTTRGVGSPLLRTALLSGKVDLRSRVCHSSIMRRTRFLALSKIGQQREGIGRRLVDGHVDLEPMIRGIGLEPDLEVDGQCAHQRVL